MDATPSNLGRGIGRYEPISISDAGFSKNHFVIPHHYRQCVDRVLIPHGLIMDRTEKLAYDIEKAYESEQLHLICLLKGSRGFFNQVLTYLNKIHTYVSSSSDDMPPYLEHYVRVKSYRNDSSTGELTVISEDLSVLRGQHVVVVEDIIDTGNTLVKFCKWLVECHSPKSVKVASLLERRTERPNAFRGDFVGFSVPPGFLVGFSLDYNEFFRDVEHICLLNEFGKKKYALPASADTPSSSEEPWQHKTVITR